MSDCSSVQMMIRITPPDSYSSILQDRNYRMGGEVFLFEFNRPQTFPINLKTVLIRIKLSTTDEIYIGTYLHPKMRYYIHKKSP
ncbi:hypothetical protein [Chryseobacterium sp. CT-SW4]|uniref:hypothetical protein n=1 Tax=Chryseobacterium sp. SW-1 TaxID=3157343 RepID=UPI003B0101B1